MADSNYVFEKGTFLVAPGGGGAMTPFLPGTDGQALKSDSTAPLGMSWVNTLPGEGDVVGPGSSTAHNLASFSNTSGKVLEDSGIAKGSVATGPGSSTAHNFVGFSNTSGNALEDTGKSSASFLAAFVSGGAADTKGSFTLSSGTHTKIATTAAVTGCCVVYSIVTLGTVTAPQAILTTIDTGVGFTPVSADATDTSVVNWRILP